MVTVEIMPLTTAGCRYTRHISESIKVGRVGSRLGRSGSGASSEGVARERRSRAWMLYVAEWYEVDVLGICSSFR